MTVKPNSISFHLAILLFAIFSPRSIVIDAAPGWVGSFTVGMLSVLQSASGLGYGKTYETAGTNRRGVGITPLSFDVYAVLGARSEGNQSAEEDFLAFFNDDGSLVSFYSFSHNATVHHGMGVKAQDGRLFIVGEAELSADTDPFIAGFSVEGIAIEPTFRALYGSTSPDVFLSVAPRDEEGCMAFGHSLGYGATTQDCLLIAVDGEGDVESSLLFGGLGEDRGQDLELYEDLVLMVGSTDSFGLFGLNAFVGCWNSTDQSFLYYKVLEGSNHTEFHRVVITSDLEGVAVGYSRLFSAGREVMMTRFDLFTGDRICTVALHSDLVTTALDVTASYNGEVLITGSRGATPLIMRVDSQCELLWQAGINDLVEGQGSSLVSLFGHSAVLITGHMQNGVNGDKKLFVSEVSADGSDSCITLISNDTWVGVAGSLSWTGFTPSVLQPSITQNNYDVDIGAISSFVLSTQCLVASAAPQPGATEDPTFAPTFTPTVAPTPRPTSFDFGDAISKSNNIGGFVVLCIITLFTVSCITWFCCRFICCAKRCSKNEDTEDMPEPGRGEGGFEMIRLKSKTVEAELQNGTERSILLS